MARIDLDAKRARRERIGHQPSRQPKDRTILHRCIICGGSLGRRAVVNYEVGPGPLLKGTIRPKEKGPLKDALGGGFRRRQGRFGVELETFEPPGEPLRCYVRIRCKCGRDEKRPLQYYQAAFAARKPDAPLYL